MDIAKFDSTRSQDRVDAIAEMLAAPSSESVTAFCRRWYGPADQCEDSSVPPDATDKQRGQAQDEYYRLQQEFTVGIQRLRAHPDGPYYCALGLGQADPGRARRALEVCLTRADPAVLLAAFTRLIAEQPSTAGLALERFLPAISEDAERHAPLAALFGGGDGSGKAESTKKRGTGEAKPKPKPKVKKAKRRTLSARLKEVLTAGRNDDTMRIARELVDDPKLKGLNRAKLLSKLAGWVDASEQQELLEQAWQTLPSKKSKDPGWQILLTALRNVIAAHDDEGVQRWFLRYKEGRPPSSFQQRVRDGDLAPWISRPGFIEHVLPKYPAAVRSITAELNASLLPVLFMTSQSAWSPHVSKVGGQPFLPEGHDWPCDGGVPMRFLAQLNFEDTPSLPGFPDSGMLLLFVPNDATMGLEFGVRRSRYGAVWLEDVDRKTAVVDAAPFEKRSAAEGYSKAPVASKPDGIRYHLYLQPAIPMDVRFRKLVPGAAKLKDKALDKFETKFWNPSGFGRHNRVGGYASFVQEDPRRGDTAEYVQLVQFDSYDPWGLMFGDGGIAHFFIHPDDLAARRFDNMLYYWDSA